MLGTLPTTTGKVDPAVTQAIGQIAAEVKRLGQVAAAPAPSSPTSGGLRPTGLTAVGTYQAIRDNLQIAGVAPLNVTGLLGTLSQPQPPGVPLVTSLPPATSQNNGLLVNLNGALWYLNATTDPGTWTELTASILFDSHANRLANYPPSNYGLGTLFWEVDRTAMYLVEQSGGVLVWVLLFTRPYRDTLANRPSDLAGHDVGFLFQNSLNGVGYIWSGAAWLAYSGLFIDVFANRPLPATVQPGILFAATDRGLQVWYLNAVLQWQVFPGWGGPMAGTLSPNTKPTLTAADVGFVFQSTDFDRLYVWTGAAWADAPGEPTRFQIAFFQVTPGTGWALCDGSATTASTAGGSTTPFTTPDLVTGTPFVNLSNATGSGTFGTTGTNYNFTTLLPYVRL